MIHLFPPLASKSLDHRTLVYLLIGMKHCSTFSFSNCAGKMRARGIRVPGPVSHFCLQAFSWCRVAQCVPENGPVAAPSSSDVNTCASESFVPGPHDARVRLGTALEALGSWQLVQWLLWFSLVCVAVAVTATFHHDSAGLLRSVSDRPRSGRVTERWKSGLTVFACRIQRNPVVLGDVCHESPCPRPSLPFTECPCPPHPFFLSVGT